MKKVFHITDHLPEYHEPWGGAEKVAYRHISILNNQKNVELYVGTVKTLKDVNEKFKHERIWVLEDLFPKKWQIFMTGFKNQIFPFDPLSFFSFLFSVLKIRPDIIHIHKANKISFAPILVGKLLGIPVVLAIYDYWYFCPGAMLIDEDANSCHKFHGLQCASCSGAKKFGLAGKIASLYRKPLFDLFYTMVSGFLVLSEFNVKLLSEYGIIKEKVFVVRQPFNPPKEKVKNQIEKGNIYMNAWMAPHKGVHIVVAAFAEVLKRIPQAKLNLETKVLIPDYAKKIKQMISKLKLNRRVEMFERKTVNDYLERIGKANLVVVAEQWENMAPTTLSDALSQGKPVVASRIGGLPEMFKDGEGGLLASPHDPEDFARKMISIIESPALAKKLSHNAPKLVESLGSGEAVRKQLLTLYRSIDKGFRV